MKRIATAEWQNAKRAMPIYERSPWLDLAARTDGIFAPCTAMIAEKVAWIERFLEGTCLSLPVRPDLLLCDVFVSRVPFGRMDMSLCH